MCQLYFSFSDSTFSALSNDAMLSQFPTDPKSQIAGQTSHSSYYANIILNNICQFQSKPMIPAYHLKAHLTLIPKIPTFYQKIRLGPSYDQKCIFLHDQLYYVMFDQLFGFWGPSEIGSTQHHSKEQKIYYQKMQNKASEFLFQVN